MEDENMKHWSDAMDPQDGTNEYSYDEDQDSLAARATGGSKLAAAEARIRRHTAELARAEAEAARLEALPTEPEVEDTSEPNVIWFTKVFQNGHRRYAYAAVKASDGLWYTTGPNSPKGYPWQRLIEWIADGEHYEIWHAVEYAPL